MEQYARLSLIYCYDKKLSLLQKGEEPDWQSPELGIGMEVTEALHPDDGRKRAVINRYFGKGLDGQAIKDQFREKYPEYSQQLHVVGNIACFSDPFDMQLKIQQVCSAIITKSKKLNDNYSKFQQNWLYVFVPELFVDRDIPVVFQAYKETTIIKEFLFYNKIFLNACDFIFVLNPEGVECKMRVSEDNLQRLKLEAQNFRT